jgi:hypothetical protein
LQDTAQPHLVLAGRNRHDVVEVQEVVGVLLHEVVPPFPRAGEVEVEVSLVTAARPLGVEPGAPAGEERRRGGALARGGGCRLRLLLGRRIDEESLAASGAGEELLEDGLRDLAVEHRHGRDREAVVQRYPSREAAEEVAAGWLDQCDVIAAGVRGHKPA